MFPKGISHLSDAKRERERERERERDRQRDGKSLYLVASSVIGGQRLQQVDRALWPLRLVVAWAPLPFTQRVFAALIADELRHLAADLFR